MIKLFQNRRILLNILVESISAINTYVDTYENDVDESEIVTGQMFGTLYLLNNNEKIDQEDSVDVEERVVEQHIQEPEWYGLENLAAFIEFRLQKKENLSYIPDTSDMSNSWVNHLSEGGLLKPNEDFLTKCNELDHIFNNFIGGTLKLSNNYLNALMNLAESVNVQYNELDFYMKVCKRLKRNETSNSTSFNMSVSAVELARAENAIVMIGNIIFIVNRCLFSPNNKKVSSRVPLGLAQICDFTEPE
ncbi:hypothetical protein QE152_g5018 [Popillia japonica]|uniref:Uncharacterized protein n=1 Tax=Popillia japonica TaxID=7064 RepID=A0AAW1MYQ6_POPJA